MSDQDHQQQAPVGVPPPQGKVKEHESPPEHLRVDAARQFVQKPNTPNQEVGCLEKCLIELCCCCKCDLFF